MVQSGVLGRITSTTVLGSDSQLMNLPEKARYVNDPASGTSASFPFHLSALGRPPRSSFGFPSTHPVYHSPMSNQLSALSQWAP